MIKIENILVPMNFSEASRYAAEYAASLARAHKARLYVLHVKEPFPVHGRIVAGSLENVQEHRIEKVIQDSPCSIFVVRNPQTKRCLPMNSTPDLGPTR